MNDRLTIPEIQGPSFTTPPLKACCQKIIDAYMTLFDPPRDQAALYCRHCSARIVQRHGAWIEETP